MKRLAPLLLCALCGCSPSQSGEVNAGWQPEPVPRAPRREEAIRVVGHVLDRNTREPVVGARIEAPGGRTAVSDAAGYFEITGFLAGESGELRASWGGDRTASTQLRPLQPGRLEVVLHLGP